MREIFLKIRSSDNMMTLIASNNFIGYVGEHLETVLKLEKQDCFEGFNICLKFQNNEDIYISEKLTIKDEFYLFKIPQILLKSGKVDVQLLLTESSPDKSEDIKIIKESSILPFICRESILEKDAQTVSDESKGLFVFKTNGDGSSYLGDDGKYHSLTYISDFIKVLQQKLNSGELKGAKGDKGDKGEQGIQGEQGQQGADGKPGLEYLPKTTSYNKLVTKMYYADEDVKITCPDSKSLNLYRGAFVLAEKKEVASGFYTVSWYLTIIGKCNFNGKEYNYGIHQYYSMSNLIYNSMYLNETELKSLIEQKQDKLTAGTGITITDNNIISYDGTLQYVFLDYGEDLPTDPTKIKKNTLYFKYNDNSGEENEATQNWYDEYIYMFSKDGSVAEDWELIGSTKIDLTGYALKTDIPTKTSELVNDSDFVSDSAYVHTDNNYTDEDKTKLAGLSNYDDTAVKQSIAAKQDKLTQAQIDNIAAVPNKQDKLTTAQLNNISAVPNKQDKLSQSQLNNIVNVPNKQDKLTVDTGLKLENNVLSLGIEDIKTELGTLFQPAFKLGDGLQLVNGILSVSYPDGDNIKYGTEGEVVTNE